MSVFVEKIRHDQRETLAMAFTSLVNLEFTTFFTMLLAYGRLERAVERELRAMTCKGCNERNTLACPEYGGVSEKVST